jgi:hypothetical protein
MRLAAILWASLLFAALGAGPAAAYPGLDKGGKGGPDGYHDDVHDDDDWRDDQGRDGAFIPAGHLPPRGLCRIWFPGMDAGQQPPPMSCPQAADIAQRSDAFVVNSRGHVLLF